MELNYTLSSKAGKKRCVIEFLLSLYTLNPYTMA